MVLISDVRLFKASIALPDEIESTILPFPNGMHTFSWSVTEVPKIVSRLAVYFKSYP